MKLFHVFSHAITPKQELEIGEHNKEHEAAGLHPQESHDNQIPSHTFKLVRLNRKSF